jgi:hypothetical protein
VPAPWYWRARWCCVVTETARGARGLCFACVLGRRYQLASARGLELGPRSSARRHTWSAAREAEKDAAEEARQRREAITANATCVTRHQARKRSHLPISIDRLSLVKLSPLLRPVTSREIDRSIATELHARAAVDSWLRSVERSGTKYSPPIEVEFCWVLAKTTGVRKLRPPLKKSERRRGATSCRRGIDSGLMNIHSAGARTAFLSRY